MQKRRGNSLALPALASLIALALAISWRRRNSVETGNSAVPEPSRPVDVDRYLGRWYELGRYDNWFERGCEAVTAEYAKRRDGLIDVINSCCQTGTRPRRRVSRGRAKIVSKSGNAKLKVSFFGPFYVGNYWILDRADDYSWSIVGEPSGRFLWILSRDRIPDEETYRDLVNRAHLMGYDMSRFRRTRQA